MLLSPFWVQLPPTTPVEMFLQTQGPLPTKSPAAMGSNDELPHNDAGLGGSPHTGAQRCLGMIGKPPISVSKKGLWCCIFTWIVVELMAIALDTAATLVPRLADGTSLYARMV